MSTIMKKNRSRHIQLASSKRMRGQQWQPFSLPF